MVSRRPRVSAPDAEVLQHVLSDHLRRPGVLVVLPQEFPDHSGPQERLPQRELIVALDQRCRDAPAELREGDAGCLRSALREPVGDGGSREDLELASLRLDAERNGDVEGSDGVTAVFVPDRARYT
jgi:hypothetical protein